MTVDLPNIPVTRPVLPSLEAYIDRLREAWSRHQLTNGGPFVVALEEELRRYLGVRHVLFVSNGTIAIQLLVKALDLRAEVVTTPFSYVATTSALVWEGCRPRFADIEPDTLTVDPGLVEEGLRAGARGVLATHVYGNPCDVEALEDLGHRYGVPILYDAAHAFGVEFRGRPLPGWGTASTLSFHATKLFHTIEGGAVVTDDDALAERVRSMRGFGHDGPERYAGLGINGKNSEIHAAMGLSLLPMVPQLLARRRAIAARYQERLEQVRPDLIRPRVRAGALPNHAYYPVVMKEEAMVLETMAALSKQGIGTRRYFYPSLTDLPYVGDPGCPVSRDVAARVLCLPMYADLRPDEVDVVCDALERL